MYQQMTLSQKLGVVEISTLWPLTPIANTDVYKDSFFPQTIRDWNALPDSLISSAEDAEDCVAKFTSLVLVSDCRFGVSPVNYPDPDPGLYGSRALCLFILHAFTFVLLLFLLMSGDWLQPVIVTLLVLFY